ncbi:MAG: response regulator [Kaiparowitsia implicata GSE-PSE-MK54-09C]|jgi:DNA-binding response OmpR family regulator|nr:response regulator [Kaiparowitsia implicata GSE-PSE-MK54-09C]
MSAKAFLALLLEDEPLIAMDMELILQGAGFDVTTVVSCVEANNWLEVRRPDIVIVDIMLRDGPSHNIVERLIQDAIPFVVHSGDPVSMYAETAFAQGPWLSKPSSPDELVGAVLALLAT